MATFHHAPTGLRFEARSGASVVRVYGDIEGMERELKKAGFIEDDDDSDAMIGDMTDLANLYNTVDEGFRIPAGLGLRVKHKVTGKKVLSW